MWNPVHWSEMEPEPSALGAWRLNHWTTSIIFITRWYHQYHLLDFSNHAIQLLDGYSISISLLYPWLNAISFFFLLGLLLCFDLRTSISFSSSLKNGREEFNTMMIYYVLHFYLHKLLLQVTWMFTWQSVVNVVVSFASLWKSLFTTTKWTGFLKKLSLYFTLSQVLICRAVQQWLQTSALKPGFRS